MLNAVIVVLILYLLFTKYLPLEGITNYNQIRSDYEWTDHYDKQFDDIRGRAVNGKGLLQ